MTPRVAVMAHGTTWQVTDSAEAEPECMYVVLVVATCNWYGLECTVQLEPMRMSLHSRPGEGRRRRSPPLLKCGNMCVKERKRGKFRFLEMSD